MQRQIRDLIEQKTVVLAPAKTSVSDAAQLMHKAKVGAVMVVDEHGKLTGIFTERYALHMMFENGFRHVPVVENGRPVGIVTSRDALGPELKEFESDVERREHI